MGAFGSCLGVGRPIRPGANPRLVGSNLVSVDANPFGPKPTSGSRQINGMRPQPDLSRHPFLSGSPAIRNGQPVSKLVRQLSSLSGRQQASFSDNSPTAQQNVQMLVDIDDHPPQQQQRNSHLICNRRQSSQLNPATPTNALTNGTGEIGASFVQRLMMEPNKIQVLVALYDYEPRTSEDLGFQKGDHLETISQEGDWYLARNKSSKKVGYVPSNYVIPLKSLGAEPWYLGKIGRAEAELRLLMPQNLDGAFMIRDSDSAGPGQYSLSLKLESSIKHYKIRQFETGGFYIDKKTVFSTIHDLVAHYSRAPYGLIINLREPCCPKGDKPATNGLSYDTCDRWEIDRNELTLLNELGRGQFGQVYEGLWRGTTRVAIKTLRQGSMDPQDFLEEAKVMMRLSHPNLIKLYGVCPQEPMFIVIELAKNGSLLNYLQTDEGKSFPLAVYINMACQIAKGMAYLESRSFVHRDLAARNILVGGATSGGPASGFIPEVKIADFGLARFIKETEYEARQGARFPIKWTAPEAANFSKFTIKSDVWSYGIVLWEIINFGSVPYPGMSNSEVLSKIERGYRMPQPAGCEIKFYNIMLECWNKDPQKRPTFETLNWKLNDYFTSDEQYREASLFRDR